MCELSLDLRKQKRTLKHFFFFFRWFFLPLFCFFFFFCLVMELDVAEESHPKKARTEEETEKVVMPPRISFLTRGGAYVWRVADIVALRASRIGGELVGADLGFPAQNISHGPPLSLSPEEVPLACRVLQIALPPSHSLDSLRARVVGELWRRGFWLAKGTSFGCDFLVYAAEPNLYHACHLLLIRPWAEAGSVLSLVTAARLGTAVKKTAVLASQKPDGEFWFLTIKWKGT